MDEVVPIYKPDCLTPTQLITAFRKQFPGYDEQKISPAGRLDPMAEGLILLLIGQANKKREYFQNLSKEYTFTILFGISTDTYDVLGKITESNFSFTSSILRTQLTNLLPSLHGEFNQPYPPFSSMTVNGKPLFYWARQNMLDTIIIPSKKITIENIDLISFVEKDKNETVKKIIERINNVKGDFRQREITEDWTKLQDNSDQKTILATCSATVSSGTYIRSLCHKIGKEIGCGAIAYAIKRTDIGDFSLKDAITLSGQ